MLAVEFDDRRCCNFLGVQCAGLVCWDSQFKRVVVPAVSS
jgi:hypothetical protein